MTPGEAYQRYGVQLRTPAVLQVDVSEAGKFNVGSEVLVEGRYYNVCTAPAVYQAGLDTDYAEILLEGKDTPLEGL